MAYKWNAPESAPMKRALALLVTPALLLAGCASSGGDADPSSILGTDPAAEGAHVVIAIIDSGINAYHHGFRDDGPEAYAHPSSYIEGYPADAEPIRLTLDAADWESAVKADCEVWNALAPDTLYWIPGTRIIGLWLNAEWAANTVDCAAGERPLKGLDTLAPHGSGAAGRAAGANTSLCPGCKIVMTQMGQTTMAMQWVAQQPWIDLQSNSWAGFECHMVDRTDTLCTRGPRELARQAAEAQVTFAASGNGIRQPAEAGTIALGVGIPGWLRPVQGEPGILIVGGHDNGDALLWPGTMPHVVADVARTPSAAWQDLEGGIFNGTSGSTPFAAGAFARILLEARKLVGDTGTGLRDGNLVIAAPDATLPTSGPLADGILTRAEAERLLLATALARPAEDQPYDGETGCPRPSTDRQCIGIERTNSLLPWTMVPTALPAYYFVGYGQVGTASLESALAVLRGTEPLPERPNEDPFFGIDDAVRKGT